MLRIFSPCFVVAASMVLAGASKADAAAGKNFPLLSDVPDRPKQVGQSARENEQDYQTQVEEMEAERREMIDRLEQLHPDPVQGGE